MSIKGFRLKDGATEKYDYNELDNLPVIPSGSGLSEEVKQALLALLEKVAYVDENGQTYYDALETALYMSTKTLVSISADYMQSGAVYDTDDLAILKNGLEVTAHYDDNTSAVIASTNYVLSGTLSVGTSTITVTHNRKTTTFNVTVTHARVPAGYREFSYIKNTSASNTNIKSRGIMTGIQLSPTYSLETSFKYPSGQVHTEATCLMGTRNGQTGTKYFALFVAPSANTLGYWFSNVDSSTTIPIAEDNVNTIKVKPVGKSTDYPSNAVIEANGTDYSTGSTDTSGTWASWFGLMQYQMSATALNGYNAWSSCIEQGEVVIKDQQDNLLYDFIPAFDGTHYGFYESVNEVFYYDQTYYSEYTGGNWE